MECYCALTPIEQKIVNILMKNEIPMTPKAISQELGISYNTVKAYLRRMVEKGIVFKSSRGQYTLPGYTGCGVYGSRVSFRVQNVMLEFRHSHQSSSHGFTFSFGKAQINIVVNRGSVIGYLSHKDGFNSYEEIALALELFKCICKELTGVCPNDDEIIVHRVEFINDYEGIRIDVKYLCLKNLHGELLKIYNKCNGVRVEFQTKPKSVQSILNFFINRYIEPFSIVSAISTIVAEINRIVNAQKFMNREIFDLKNEFLKFKEECARFLNYFLQIVPGGGLKDHKKDSIEGHLPDIKEKMRMISYKSGASQS